MNFDLAAIKRKMLVKYPFFGRILANIDYKEAIGLNTAGTNGKTIYYDPQFMASLKPEGQLFILAHEVCHIAFNHILRSKGKDKEIWNIATDAVINQFLMKDGLELPDDGVNIPEAINYDAEQLYEKLLQERGKQDKQSGQNQNNNSQGQGSSSEGQGDESQDKDVGHDTHKMWADAVKEHEEEEKNKEQNGEDQQAKGNDQIEQEQEKNAKIGEKEGFKQNQEEKKKQLESLKKELTKNAAQAGDTSYGNLRNVGNIGYSKPIVDWRYVLKEAVTSFDVDWTYKNATIENGVLTPHLEELPVPETEIVIDTSGSINETLLKNFLRECKNILQHTRLKVGCFDTIFYGFHDIRTEKDIENMKFEGGGGTSFDVAVSAFTGRVENKIIFTDGEARMPKTALNAIWIVFGNTKINPPGGKVIYITGEQLNRLYSFENNSPKRSR